MSRRSGQPDLLSTPSREDVSPPSAARTVGLVGIVFMVLGGGMWAMNAYQATPRFNPNLVIIWILAGVCALLYHAARDRDAIARRSYGLVGFFFFAYGFVQTTVAIVTQWISPAQGEDTALMIGTIIGACSGLAVLIASTMPFVREEVHVPPEVAQQGAWLGRFITGLKTSNLVQKIAVFGGILIITFTVLSFFLVKRYSPTLNFVHYGIGAMIIGLPFLLSYFAAEDEPGWREAGVFPLAVVGAVLALTGLSSVIADRLNLEEMLLPYGLIFSILGLLLMWAFCATMGSDSNAGFGTAIGFGSVGLIVLVLALIRSFIPGMEFPTPSLQVPTSFLLCTLGGLYAIVGWCLAGDNRLLIMTRRELAAFFFSPIAYIVIGGIAFFGWLSGYLFYLDVDPSRTLSGAAALPEPIVGYFIFGWFPVICLLISVPMVTMRLISEEQRTGTVEVLMTAPVGEVSIVLSKFFAALIFFILAWLTWLLFPIALRVIGSEGFDYRPLLSFYLGLTCMSAGFIAMGLFFSSLTRNQIIAFLLAFLGMMVLTAPFFMMRYFSQGENQSEAMVNTLQHLSYIHHIAELVDGKVSIRYLLFHLSSCVFWLFVTVKVLEARKWR